MKVNSYIYGRSDEQHRRLYFVFHIWPLYRLGKLKIVGVDIKAVLFAESVKHKPKYSFHSLVDVEQSRLIGVEAFVEGARHVLRQQGLELLPRGHGRVAREGESACHAVAQRACHGGQVGVLWTQRIVITHPAASNVVELLMKRKQKNDIKSLNSLMWKLQSRLTM